MTFGDHFSLTENFTLKVKTEDPQVFVEPKLDPKETELYIFQLPKAAFSVPWVAHSQTVNVDI